MTRYLAGLEHRWSGLTLRERRMLLVMAVLLLATVVWLGLVRPVLTWRTAAGDRAAAAAVTLAEVRAATASLAPATAAAPTPAEGLEPLIRRTSAAAGLEVVTDMSSSGRLGFKLSRVSSGPLFAWLSGLETDHHLTLCSLGVVKNADATLNVEGGLSFGSCVG